MKQIWYRAERQRDARPRGSESDGGVDEEEGILLEIINNADPFCVGQLLSGRMSPNEYNNVSTHSLEPACEPIYLSIPIHKAL